MVDIETAQRNGDLRRRTLGIRKKAAEVYNKIFPDDSANNLSVKAAFANIVSSGISEYQNRVLSPTACIARIPNLFLAIISELGDSIDGELARLIEEKTGRKSKGGAILDTALDRITTAFKVIARADSAHARGDLLGEALAYTAGFTGTLTSLGRKYAASRNVAVSEDGRGLGRIGTHPYRAGLGIFSTNFPPLQPALDALSVAGDLVNAGVRFYLGYSQGKGENPVEKRRLRVLIIEAGVIGAVLAGNFIASRINGRRKIA